MPRLLTRVRLEDGLKLDMNFLVQKNVVRPGAVTESGVRWCYQHIEEGVASGAVTSDLTGDLNGWLRLQWNGMQQEFGLQRRLRRFGGGQWYFVCPKTNRIASILWLPPGAKSFASRQAWGRQVAYSSQFQTPKDRALSTAQNIRVQLGGPDSFGMIQPFPDKPKWMRWATYERTIRRYLAYQTASMAGLDRFMERLERRG